MSTMKKKSTRFILEVTCYKINKYVVHLPILADFGANRLPI